MPSVMKTLLLNPPSFKNFDGGASSRWPATREIESFWYPVWLSYPGYQKDSISRVAGQRELAPPSKFLKLGGFRRRVFITDCISILLYLRIKRGRRKFRGHLHRQPQQVGVSMKLLSNSGY